ncbi:hypothetical protein D9M73_119250 [compost metagenome]
MLVLVENAELRSEHAAIVGQPREIGRRQIGIGLAPCQVDVRGIGRSADQHRVTIFEIALQARITDDLGRADEGEILRPVEQHLPLARKGVLAERFTGGQRVDALLDGNGEIGELIANGQHSLGLLKIGASSGILTRGAFCTVCCKGHIGPVLIDPMGYLHSVDRVER